MFPSNVLIHLIVILAQVVSFGGFFSLLSSLPISAAPAQHSHQTIHKDGLSVHTVGHGTQGIHHAAHSVITPFHHAPHHAPLHTVQQSFGMALRTKHCGSRRRSVSDARWSRVQRQSQSRSCVRRCCRMLHSQCSRWHCRGRYRCGQQLHSRCSHQLVGQCSRCTWRRPCRRRRRAGWRRLT